MGMDDGKEPSPPWTVGWKMFKGAFDIMYGQQLHLNVGDEIPSDLELFDLATGSKRNLKDMIPKAVPLILNFGSCT